MSTPPNADVVCPASWSGKKHPLTFQSTPSLPAKRLNRSTYSYSAAEFPDDTVVPDGVAKATDRSGSLARDSEETAISQNRWTPRWAEKIIGPLMRGQSNTTQAPSSRSPGSNATRRGPMVESRRIGVVTWIIQRLSHASRYFTFRSPPTLGPVKEGTTLAGLFARSQEPSKAFGVIGRARNLKTA